MPQVSSHRMAEAKKAALTLSDGTQAYIITGTVSDLRRIDARGMRRGGVCCSARMACEP